MDVLLVVDAINDFHHEDGDALARSFDQAADAMADALAHARGTQTPVVYVNDARGRWDGDRDAHVERARHGLAGSATAKVAPQPGDLFIFKPRYSAFESTPLRRILEGLDARRIVLVGTATEMCIAQTAIHGHEHGLQVTVLRDACADVDPDAAAIAISYLERVTGTFIGSTSAWSASAASGR